MAQFSRRTFWEACNVLGHRFAYHGQFEDLMYRWELDSLAEKPAGAIHQRCRELFKYLKDNPDATYDGRSLIDLVVEEAASMHVMPLGGSDDSEFGRALKRDGFAMDNALCRFYCGGLAGCRYEARNL